jgi:2-keto-4-pentenoate hydratase
MRQDAIEQAVQALVAARRSGERLEALPEDARPANLDDAHAIQDATVLALGELAAGWKVASGPAGLMRGAILQSCLVASPAVRPAAQVPLLGIEGEIAFRFERNLAARDHDYSRDEIVAVTTALVGIEIVSSRFRSYEQTPVLHRTADFMSNGLYVTGTARPDWRDIALEALEATLTVNGDVVARQRGAHPTGDPLLLAITLANVLRKSTGVRAGQNITTGTCTGLHFGRPGDRVLVEFTGFGTAEIHLTGP